MTRLKRKKHSSKDTDTNQQPFQQKQWALAATSLLLFLWFFGVFSRTESSTTTLRGESFTADQESLPIEPPSEGSQFYFAYASDLLQDRLRKGSSKTAKVVEKGWVENLAFDYPIVSKVWKGGVADLVSKQGSKAWGIVWEFPEADVSNLDKQKGIQNEDAKYKKVTMTVHGEDGRVFHAFTYVLNEDKRQRDPTAPNAVKRFAPSKQYRNCILKGARQANLPESYIAELSAIHDNGEKFKRKSVGNACD